MVTHTPSKTSLEEYTSVISPKPTELGESSQSLLLYIKPERVDSPHGVLKLHVKSEAFEKFFKSLCPDKELFDSEHKLEKFCLPMTRAKRPDGSPIYLMRMGQVIESMSGKHTEDFVHSDYQTPNMCILSAVGLGEGIDFIFQGMYTDDVISLGLKNFSKKATDIFKKYMKKTSTEIEIRIKEVC